MKREAMEKLDEQLREVCEEAGSERQLSLPVIVRFEEREADDVLSCINEFGGQIRHRFKYVSALAAMIPVGSLLAIAACGGISTMELEQEFSIA